MSLEDWRDQPKFAALRPVIEWMDETNAENTYAEVQRNCKILAEAIRHPDAFRRVVQATNLGALADLYLFLDALADEMEEHEAPLAVAATPWVIGFRDMASSEAIRRGLIVSEGRNPYDKALATCIAMTLGYDPRKVMQ